MKEFEEVLEGYACLKVGPSGLKVWADIFEEKNAKTMCTRDLDKLNLVMVVWF